MRVGGSGGEGNLKAYNSRVGGSDRAIAAEAATEGAAQGAAQGAAEGAAEGAADAEIGRNAAVPFEKREPPSSPDLKSDRSLISTIRPRASLVRYVVRRPSRAVDLPG